MLQGSVGTILAGDLNCPPDSLEMCLLRALLPQLHDCWHAVHPQAAGYTANACSNSFTKPGEHLMHPDVLLRQGISLQTELHRTVIYVTDSLTIAQFIRLDYTTIFIDLCRACTNCVQLVC